MPEISDFFGGLDEFASSINLGFLGWEVGREVVGKARRRGCHCARGNFGPPDGQGDGEGRVQ